MKGRKPLSEKPLGCNPLHKSMRNSPPAKHARREKKRSAAALALGIAFVSIALTILGAIAFLTLQPAEEQDAISPPKLSEESSTFPQVNWKKLQKLNPDVVAWVCIPGTGISQPVVQAHSDTAEFYLSHNLKGEYSAYGCPYLSPENEERGLESDHCLIYGHHLDIGGAFSDLTKYQEESWAKNHQEILLLTPEENMCLQVAFVQRVRASEYPIQANFPTQSAYETWLLGEYQSAFVTLSPPNPEARSYSLVTCDAGYDTDWRIIVTAQEKAEPL